MKCDKNMGLINQKAPCETRNELSEKITKARVNPKLFIVIDCKQDKCYSWNEHLYPYFSKTRSFPPHPLHELKLSKDEPGKFLYGNSFPGHFTTSDIWQIVKSKGRKKIISNTLGAVLMETI